MSDSGLPLDPNNNPNSNNNNNNNHAKTNPFGSSAVDTFRSNNNSFALPETPMLASTKPFGNDSAVERFLSDGGMAGSLNQPSANSSFVSIPKSFQQHQAKKGAAPTTITASESSALPAPKPQRVTEVSMLPSAASSTTTAVYRDPTPKPAATAVPPILTVSESSSQRPAVAARNPTSSNRLSPSRQSPRRVESRAGSPSSFRYSPVSPDTTREQDYQDFHRRTPFTVSGGRRSPRMGADTELTSLFSGTPSSRRKTPSSSGGLNTGSVASRSKMGSVHANSVSNTDLGQQPAWMGAVERINTTRPKEGYGGSALPIDKSSYGLQQRRQQQNTLTVGRLRELEQRNTPGSSNKGTPAYPLVAHETVTPSESASARRSKVRASFGGRQTPPLRSSDYAPPSRQPAAAPSLYASECSANPMIPFRTLMNRINHKKPSGNTLPPGGILVATESAGTMPGSSYSTMNNNNGNNNSNNTTANNNNNSNGNSNNSRSAYGNNSNYTSANKRGSGASAGGGGAGDGGDGGDGNGNNNDFTDNNPDKSKRKKVDRHLLESAAAAKSAALAKALEGEGDKEGREERNLRVRNMNAIHAIPWDQRRQMPMSGFGTRFFSILSSPRFWEKCDWTFRGAILTILPTMILSLEPATTNLFPMSSSLAFNAFWISAGTFGSGMHEFFIAFKGFSFGLVILVIVVAINPGPEWLSLLLLFLFTLFSSFIAEETKKTAAYVITSTIMAYIKCPRGSTDEACNGPNEVNFDYIGVYYSGLLCALAFGLAAFLIPFIRWSSNIATHYIAAMGNALSIQVQGTCLSFWTDIPLERELNVLRIRQLRMMANKCIERIQTALGETAYEPHSGVYISALKTRFNFCISLHNILGSMTQVVELIAAEPALTDTPMCHEFGAQIGEEVAIIASAIDSMILKIVDFNQYVTPVEILFFRQARERFQEALSQVRENVILNNESYETDESDIFLGFFMFSIDELCEVIANFEEDPHPKNNICHYLKFVIRDFWSSIEACKNLYRNIVFHRTIPRRMKEAIKLSLCMTIPSIFQVYTFNLNDMSAFGGASIIALIYNPTGSESFHYASGRLLGTVLGSTASYLCVQIANGRRWVLYIFIALLSLVGCYVQAAPGWYALGNAIACSTISVITQYKDLNAAMTRIQQNSFAILIYFAITSLIWPMRARKRVRMGLDVSLRCLRESCARLLRNLDMPLDASEVAADVSALLKEMNTKIISQHKYIAGAVEEPTMSSAEYPEEPMRQIVMAERRIWSTLSLMRFAYNSFMASDTEDTEISVHWVVLHRIAPHAQNLADLVYSLMDLYLLSLSKTTVVPTSHLARIRLAMIETENAIINTYIETIRRKVAGVDDDDDGSGHYDDDENDSYYSGASSSAPATITSGMSPRPHHGNDDDDDPPLKPPAKETKKEEGDTGSHGDEQTEPKKKKKTGYLGYQLTDDEKQALRNFIQGKVTNNSFNNTNNAMSNILSSNAPNLNNSFINNMSFGNTGTMFNNNNTFASRMSAALSGQSASAAPIIGNTPGATASSFGTTGDNTNRLMALAGNDTGLAAELRKKHGVVSKTEKVEKEMAEAAKKEEKEEKKKDKDDDDDMFNNTLSNASFLKNNSFLKNTSFIGALFKRKNKKQHDLDDEDMDDHHSKKTEEEEEDPSRSVSLSNRTHTPAPRPGTCTPDEGNRMEFSRRSDGSHRSFDEDERTPAKEKQDNEKALASTLKEPAKDEDDEKSGEKALEATVKGSNKEDDGEEEKSGDTTKKVVSPKTSTTDDEAKEAKKSGSSSPKKTEAHSDEDETLDKTTRQTDDKHSATTKSAHGGLTFGSVGDADEVLNNISFFDPDRGEFVLTNHDIHSLEAFLFGTRALVTYINDLQNAILDMQHSSELAKYL